MPWRLALALLCASCASGPQPAAVSDEVQVETVTLDLLPEGHGTIGFVLQLASPAGESCTVTRVEWELQLQSRDFATGLSTANVLVPGGQRARVTVEEPVAFGGMGYDGRARTVPVALRGVVFTQWSGGETKRPFSFRTRVAVRGAPLYDR
ncbi:MAG: hypothetical protein IPJ65_20435 [Archangiaceae bacterium]|nr:hypothetical protein [Archangiaceae bacterium]